MNEAADAADTAEAKWLIGKLAWQPEYLALAVKFRELQRAGDEKQTTVLRR